MIINHREVPILKPCISLILGILISQYISVQIRISSIFIYAALLFFGWQILTKRKTGQFLRNLSLLFLMLCFGISSMQERDPTQQSFPYDLDSEQFTLRIEKIQAHKKHKKCIANILSSQRNDSIFIKSKGKLLVYFANAAKDSSIKVGQEYLVKGKLSNLSTVTNPHAFDYGKYLKREGIYHQLFIKEDAYKFFRINEKSKLHAWILHLQNTASNIFRKNFPIQSNQALVNAMVLGNRDELSQDQKQLFIDTGAIHVLAVSGLHVGILCMFLSFLLKLICRIIPIHKTIQGLLIIGCIWIFAMVTGASSAVCRAALMFSLFYIAKDIIRRYVSVYNVIFSSAFILLLFDPQQVFKVSFQFSYLAVLSIVFFFPYVNSWVNSRFKILNYFWSSIALGISAQVLVFPISIFYFNKFASSFLLSSIFVVQFAMIILVSCLLILILEFLGLFILSQKILAPLTNAVLDLFQTLISKVQSLPHSSIDNIWLDNYQLILAYLILCFLMLFIKLKKISHLIFGIALFALWGFYSYQAAHNHSIQHKAFIYNDREGSIDVFVGQNCYHFHKENNEGKLFVYGRNRLAHQINSSEQLDDSISHNAIEFKKGILRLGNIFVAFANASTFTEVISTSSYDYLIVGKSNGELLEIDYSLIKDTEIILDGSLAPWERSDMIDYCLESGLSYHDVKSMGAKSILF